MEECPKVSTWPNVHKLAWLSRGCTCTIRSMSTRRCLSYGVPDVYAWNGWTLGTLNDFKRKWNVCFHFHNTRLLRHDKCQLNGEGFHMRMWSNLPEQIRLLWSPEKLLWLIFLHEMLNISALNVTVYFHTRSSYTPTFVNTTVQLQLTQTRHLHVRDMTVQHRHTGPHQICLLIVSMNTLDFFESGWLTMASNGNLHVVQIDIIITVALQIILNYAVSCTKLVHFVE